MLRHIIAISQPFMICTLFYFLYGCENTKKCSKLILIKEKMIWCNTALFFFLEVLHLSSLFFGCFCVDLGIFVTPLMVQNLKKRKNSVVATIKLANGISELSLKIVKKRFTFSTVIKKDLLQTQQGNRKDTAL